MSTPSVFPLTPVSPTSDELALVDAVVARAAKAWPHCRIELAHLVAQHRAKAVGDALTRVSDRYESMEAERDLLRAQLNGLDSRSKPINGT